MFIRKLLPYIFLLIASRAFPQVQDESRLDSAAKGLMKKIAAQDETRSYIISDKSIYQAGDRIWFRVILLGSVSQLPSQENNPLYVELVNDAGISVTNLILNAERIHLDGMIRVPGQTPEGNYWLRAYTRSMAERNPAQVMAYPVYISNQQQPVPKSPKSQNKSKDSIQLQFFPEGGAIMTGTNSTITILAKSFDDQPLMITGRVIDNLDSIVGDFSTDKYGLGKFTFYPKGFRKYSAKLEWNGRQLVYQLPPFNFNAAQLAVFPDNSGGKKIRVLLEDGIYKDDYRTYLLGIARDSLYVASIGTGMYEMQIPQKIFPQGIATFYLLDKDLNILSERSVYFRENNLFVDASLNKPNFSKREKATLSISVTDVNQQPVLSSVGISIAASELIQSQDAGDLMGDYLQNGPGSISNWPLTRADGFSDEQLDMLMMQRMNRPVPPSTEKNQAVGTPKKDTILYIRGRVISGEQVAGKIVMLFSREGNMLLGVDTSGRDGRFCFPLQEYPDSTRFMIQVTNLTGKAEEAVVSIDTVAFPILAGRHLPAKSFSVSPALVKNYLLLNTGKNGLIASDPETLGNVTVRANKKAPDPYASQRISPYSRIVASQNFQDKPGSVKDAMLSQGGLSLVQGFVTVGGLMGMQPNASTEPIIVIDGIDMRLPGGDFSITSPVLSFLNQLDPATIDFIEVLDNSAAGAFGMRGGHGVIMIHSRLGGVGETGKGKMNSIIARGFNTAPAFPVPEYGNKKTKGAANPDNRSTLYWKAVNLTDSSGKITIPFFTSDIPGNYDVVVSGITVHGDLIYKKIHFLCD